MSSHIAERQVLKSLLSLVQLSLLKRALGVPPSSLASVQIVVLCICWECSHTE